MVRKTSKQVIKAFAKKVKKDFGDAKIVFFGSRARKDELLESDYDVLVVSKKFKGMRFYGRTEKMYNYWNEKQSLEAICYTPEEFRQKSKEIGLVQEAGKTGIKI
ncbi:MAG: nucleotidyltransferase domain-containing protein [Candidatus Diapherotrites archaeon]